MSLVFESASFTQSIHAIIGSFTDIAKIVVLLLQKNMEFVVKFKHLRCFLANLLLL